MTPAPNVPTRPAAILWDFDGTLAREVAARGLALAGRTPVSA